MDKNSSWHLEETNSEISTWPIVSYTSRLYYLTLSDITFITYITLMEIYTCSLNNLFLSGGTRRSPWGKDEKGENYHQKKRKKNYHQKKRKSTRSYCILGNLSATCLSTCYINSWFFFVLILIVVLYLFHFWADFEGWRRCTGVWVWKVNVLVC